MTHVVNSLVWIWILRLSFLSFNSSTVQRSINTQQALQQLMWRWLSSSCYSVLALLSYLSHENSGSTEGRSLWIRPTGSLTPLGFCFVSQAKVSNLSSAVIVIRVMRDLCKRVPDWSSLSEWVRHFFILSMIDLLV